MKDLELNGMVIKDEGKYERNSTVSDWRVYRFYLGDHGPFTEKVPLDNFDASEIDRRVIALRAHLSSLPK